MPTKYTLLEIMNLFEAARVQGVIDELRSVACAAERLSDEYRGSTDSSEPNFTKRALAAVRAAAMVCHAQGFEDAQKIAERAGDELTYPREYSMIQSEARHVADAISDELGKRCFVTVSPSLAPFIENPSWLGEDVENTFDDATHDIYEAGNCLGTERSTAAVFHLMRVVEWGLRYFCVHLGLRKAKIRKGKLVPISYVDWETMLNQLQPIVDAKIEKMRRGRKKQQAQELHYSTLQDIRGIRDAWRNHLMHTRAVYSVKEAEAIAGHVKRLMSMLSKMKMAKR